MILHPFIALLLGYILFCAFEATGLDKQSQIFSSFQNLHLSSNLSQLTMIYYDKKSIFLSISTDSNEKQIFLSYSNDGIHWLDSMLIFSLAKNEEIVHNIKDPFLVRLGGNQLHVWFIKYHIHAAAGQKIRSLHYMNCTASIPSLDQWHIHSQPIRLPPPISNVKEKGYQSHQQTLQSFSILYNIYIHCYQLWYVLLLPQQQPSSSSSSTIESFHKGNVKSIVLYATSLDGINWVRGSSYPLAIQQPITQQPQQQQKSKKIKIKIKSSVETTSINSYIHRLYVIHNEEYYLCFYQTITTTWTSRRQPTNTMSAQATYPAAEEADQQPQIVYSNSIISLARSITGVEYWEHHRWNPLLDTPLLPNADAAAVPFFSLALKISVMDETEQLLLQQQQGYSNNNNATNYSLQYKNTRFSKDKSLGKRLTKHFIWQIYSSTPTTSTSTLYVSYLYDLGFNRAYYQSITNSAYLQGILLTYPVAWQAPTLLVTLIDEHYLHAAELFVESLLGLGYTAQDLYIICVSIPCIVALQEQMYSSWVSIIPHVYINRQFVCMNRKRKHRCIISSAKLFAILEMLTPPSTPPSSPISSKLSASHLQVFFFDNDVYFKRSPMPSSSLLNSSLLLLAQDNGDSGAGVRYNHLNFGCFLVRSHPQTYQQFLLALINFELSPYEWDQSLFNFHAIHLQIPYVLFPPSIYYVFDSHHKPNMSTVILVHMVCFEGALNKLYFAKHAYSPFHLPNYYHPHSVSSSGSSNGDTISQHQRGLITIHAKKYRSRDDWVKILAIILQMVDQYGGGGDQSDQDEDEEEAGRLQGSHSNVTITRAKSSANSAVSRRRLRIQQWNTNGIALLSADALYRDGYVLVEANYWHSVQYFYPSFVKKVKVIEVNTRQDVDRLVNISQGKFNHGKGAEEKYDVYDDIEIHIDNTMIKHLPEVKDKGKYEKYLCKLWNSGLYEGKCLQTCNGDAL